MVPIQDIPSVKVTSCACLSLIRVELILKLTCTVTLAHQPYTLHTPTHTPPSRPTHTPHTVHIHLPVLSHTSHKPTLTTSPHTDLTITQCQTRRSRTHGDFYITTPPYTSRPSLHADINLIPPLTSFAHTHTDRLARSHKGTPKTDSARMYTQHMHVLKLSSAHAKKPTFGHRVHTPH